VTLRRCRFRANDGRLIHPRWRSKQFWTCGEVQLASSCKLAAGHHRLRRAMAIRWAKRWSWYWDVRALPIASMGSARQKRWVRCVQLRTRSLFSQRRPLTGGGA